MTPALLRQGSRWLLTVLVLVSLLFGGVVLFKSIGLERRQGDFGCFCRAGWAIRQGGTPLYHVRCDNHWHYNYPPLFAILMAPFADPPRRDQSLMVGTVLSLSNAPGCGPLLAAIVAAANPTPMESAQPTYYLNYAVSVLLFYLINLLLLACAVHLLVSSLERHFPLPDDAEAARRRFWIWRLGPVIVCLPMIGLTLVRGQVQIILLLLLAGMIAGVLRGKGVLAGLCIGGAICLKLFPAFLVVLPLWRRDLRCLVGVGLGLVAGLGILPVVVLGPAVTAAVYRDYAKVFILPAIGVGENDSRAAELFDATGTQSQSFQVILHKCLHLRDDQVPRQPATWIKAVHWSIGAAMALATLFFLSRRWADPLAVVAGLGMLALVMILISPVCHLHYLVLALPLILALIAHFDLDGSRCEKVGLCLLLAGVIAAWSLPMIPGLLRLRDVGVPMYGGLALWLAAWCTRWQVKGCLPRHKVFQPCALV